MKYFVKQYTLLSILYKIYELNEFNINYGNNKMYNKIY